MGDESKSGRKASGDSYTVGYGKPPKHTRFKPGQSGNPKGRPKGTRNFTTDVKATLTSKVNITRDGRPRKISTQKAMLLRLREKALSGEARALDRAIALAETYNNEERAGTPHLSADDAQLLDIFKARVLTGAVGPVGSVETSEDSEDQSAGGAITSPRADRARTTKKPRTKIPRYRLKTVAEEDE